MQEIYFLKYWVTQYIENSKLIIISTEYILRRQSEAHHVLYFICFIYVYTWSPGTYDILGLFAQSIIGAA